MLPKKVTQIPYEVVSPEEGYNGGIERTCGCRPNKGRYLEAPPYDGRSCVESCLAQFDTCAEYNGWNEVDKVAHIKMCLRGSVSQILWDKNNSIRPSLAEIKRTLR